MVTRSPVPRPESGEALVALDALVRTIWSRSGRWVPSDVRDDCELEAKLALWRAHRRLERLPVEDQPRYAATCVRRAVFRVLHMEIRARWRCVSLEALQPVRAALEPVSERDTAAEALARGRLRDQIDRPDLAAAVSRLAEKDERLLDLAFRQQLTDREIAGLLRMQADATKKRRQRIFAAIRRAMGAGRGGEA